MKRLLIVLAVLVMAATPALADTQLWAARQGTGGKDRWDIDTKALLNPVAPEAFAGEVIARGITQGPGGFMYMTDTPTAAVAPVGRVLRYNPTNGALVDVFADGTDGLLWPWGVASDGTNLYVTDYYTDNIHRFSANGNPNGAVGGSIHNVGGASNTSLGEMVYLGGQLFISNSSNGTIRVFDAASGVEQSSITQTVDPGAIGGLAAGPDGKLYFTRISQNAIYRMNPDGTAQETVMTIANDANLVQTTFLAFNPANGLLGVAIANNAVVREFDLTTLSFVGPQFVPHDSGSAPIRGIAYTPEPASLALLGLGGLMMLRRRRA